MNDDDRSLKIAASNEELVVLAIRTVCLGLLAYWSLLLIRPFLTIIVWSVIIAVALYPIFDWLSNKLYGRRAVAALVVTVFSLFVMLGPVTWLGLSLAASVRLLGRDSRVGGGQALDSVGGRHRKIEPTPGQSCSEGLPLRALPTQTVSSRQPCWELSLHLNQRLTALANSVPTRSAVAARRSEVLISSVGCQNESISPPHLISALEL